MEKGFIQRSILVWISVITVSASIPFGMSLAGPENAKMMTGGSFIPVDEGLAPREVRERADLDRKEKEWREWIEEERMSSSFEGDDIDERWIGGDLEKLGMMAEALKKKDEARRSDEARRFAEAEAQQVAKDRFTEELSEVKSSLLPGMRDLVKKSFSTDECEERMISGRDLSESTIKEMIEGRVAEVCGDGEDHRAYLMKTIDRLDELKDMGEFHHGFGESFREFERSAMAFEQFVKSEIRRLDQLVRLEIERLEIERSRIKKDPSVGGEIDCEAIIGASIFGYRDGRYEFIGSISNPADPNSIANDLGAGNRYGSSSIFNEFGRYGKKDGEYSAFGSAASEPPVLVDRENRLLSYLTVNGSKEPRIDSYKAYHCAKGSFRSSISAHEGKTLYRWIDDLIR